jgi:glycosyltransferase involved in cell wall biosynthesis
MKNNFLTVVVLSHNRPHFIKKCLDSIISQDYPSFKLVISENSTNDSVFNLLVEQFPAVEIRRRWPALSSVDHYHLVLSELDSDFTMLFHDDDFLIRNDALSEMMGYFSEDVTAVAGNAYHLYDNVPSTKKFFETQDTHKEFVLSKDIFTLHLRGEISPYPSYIYRSSVLRDVKSEWVTFGKYIDAYIVSSLAERGKVIWVAKPIMNYRIHANNDSQKMDIEALENLINYGYGLGVQEKDIALFYFPTMLLIFLKQGSFKAILRASVLFLKYPVHITYFLTKRFLRRFNSIFALFRRISNQIK